MKPAAVRKCLAVTVSAATCFALGVLGGVPVVAAGIPSSAPIPYPVSPTPVHQDVSPPLASLQPENYNFPSALGNDRGAKGVPRHGNGPAVVGVASLSAPNVSTPTPGANFDGIGQGFGGYTVCCAPPDTNASVGPNHIVETVNLDLAVWNKAGVLLYGPVPINTVWSGFGGGCQIDNDGDPSVLYDPIADRWIISQFAVTTTHYLMCVAVTQSADPTGAYFRYSYSYSDFPDYPKLGVWSDAYYVTFNMFAGGVSFSGGVSCALDRSKMLIGAVATQKCFNVGNYGGLMPASLDGANLPSAGSPNYVLALDTNATLVYWRFHVDWSTPGTTLTGPTSLPVGAYTPSCSTFARNDCIPQGGTTQRLESMADRLMYRLAYRNFGDHEAMVVNHTIEVGSGSSLHSGVRWYEMRPDATHNLSVFQEGTYAPDSNWRWMGSAAMDKTGNIALGYSVSSASVSPQIHFTGRLVGDPLGTMSQGENTIINGAGSQIGGLARWGDYTSMAIDPADGCTFWYANEYLKASGSFNWSTRIASFKLPSCGSPDFSIGATPASVTVTAGNPAIYNVSVTASGGFSGSVGLSVSGLPGGTAGAFNPTSVAGSGTSTLSVSTLITTPAGSYPLSVTGTSGALNHSIGVTLVVNAPPTPDFSLSASPSSQSVVQGGSTSYTVNITRTNGFTGSITFSASGWPSGAGGTFAPNPAASTDASSLLSVTTSATTPVGNYPITITGSSGLLSHTTSATLVVNPPADYSLSVSPSSVTLNAGLAASYSVTITRVGGFAGGVSLSVSGLPSGAAGNFSPNPATSTSSTLSVTTATTTPAGSYPLIITGTSGLLSHSASATLVVSSPPPGDFSLSASPSSLSVKRGASGKYTVNITRTGGFSSEVTLSVSGLPAGTTASFSPNPATSTSSTLSVRPGSSTPSGTYVLTIKGVSGNLTHTVTVTLHIR